ncbi:type II toxin-antitoxin system PemK/MazF family toxin [Bacillus infantis]|nr:type II toxin-antitoxin system PemK/MazF family toxin [Bacillus infantis]
MKVDLSKVSRLITWSSLKISLHSRAESAKSRKVKRGQVYECYFGENIGSEESKQRPCLILQNDVGNIKSPNTIVAPITNTPGEKKVTVPIVTQYDGSEVILSGNVLLGNIVTVSKARLGNLITTLPTDELIEVDEKMMVSLGLYAKFKNLKDKLERDKKFIERIKNENYTNKKLLKDIRSKLEIGDDEDILAKIEEFFQKS